MAGGRALPRAFYARPTLEVAADLIGKVLVHDVPGARASGLIVEAEAYIGEDDPACHAAPGPTRRNEPLYGPPGVAYVYFNYGVHYLVNAVTEAEGSPAAVLIRALEPREGVAHMRERRRREPRVPARAARPLPDEALCRGPGNLTRALGLDLRHNRLDLTSASSALRVEEADGDALPPGTRLAWGPRIGIRVGVDKPWRVWVAGHRCVSGGSRNV